MKRLLALLMCLVMVLSLIPAAAAEDIEIVEIETGREDIPEDTGEEELIAIIDPEETLTPPGDELMASKPTITTQPASVKACVGTTAKFTVQADGATGYQWYYRTSSSGTWSKSSTTGATTATLSVAAETKRSGYQYRCKVSNSAGYVYTSAATLTVTKKPVITQQPESLTIITGGTAKYTVKASGATAYQWYWRANAEDSWHKSTVSTAGKATLVYTNLSSSKSGRQYKCKVSNDAGYVYSTVATLSVEKKPAITQQPESLTIGAGGTAKFTVKAEGATAYQWYWRANKNDSWHKSTVSTGVKSTLVYTNLSSGKSGRQYKCKISSAEGYIYSKVATLTVSSEKPTIAAQPLSYTAGAGAKVKFGLEASCANSYQWQYRKSSADSWKNSSLTGNQTDTLTVSATTARSGYEYRCVLKNANGTVYSRKAVLTVVDKQCGDNLTWTLDGNGLLTVSGTGPIYDCSEWGCDSEEIGGWGEVVWNPPWGTSPRKAVITAGVTGIGDYAFNSCSLLKSVTIPDSVTSIGNSVFKGCSALTDMAIGAGLDANEILKILPSAEMLTALTVSADNPFCMTQDHVLFSKDQTELIFCLRKKNGAYTIPDGVRVIGEDAFDRCTALTSVTIPDSVTDVANGLFCGCSGLTEVTIGRGITSLPSIEHPFNSEDEHYWYCPTGFFESCTSLRSVTIPESVTSIGAFAFRNCTSLQSVMIPDSVTKTGGAVFCGCSALSRISIGSGLSQLADYEEHRPPEGPGDDGTREYSFFEGCGSLTDVAIGAGLDANEILKILTSADKLTALTVSADNPFCMVQDHVLFSKDQTELLFCLRNKSGAYTIPDGVSRIREEAFSGCAALTSVTIPDSVTDAAGGLFFGCSGLAEVTIGSGITSLPSTEQLFVSAHGHCCRPIGFFESCTSLRNVTIPDSVTSIGAFAFRSCTALTSVTIPDSVTDVAGGLFFGCSGLTEVTIGSGITSLPSTEYLFESEDENYYCRTGFFESCTSLRSVTIPESVTSIGEFAFRNCTSLQSVTIPDSVTSIGGAAFCDCSSLKQVSLGNGIRALPSAELDEYDSDYDAYFDAYRGFFDGCTSLTSVTIPDGLAEIETRAFCCCSALTSIVIPDSVSKIDGGAFLDCTGLTSVTIGSGLRFIYLAAFSGCRSLTDVYYRGTEDQWHGINIIEDGNIPLLDATIHYNA